MIEQYLKIHSDLGTIDYAIDGDKIIGLVRFNVSEDGETGHILDLAIHPDYRGQGLGKRFILKALRTFPKGKYLEFERGRKANKKTRRILISEFLKHNNF